MPNPKAHSAFRIPHSAFLLLAVAYLVAFYLWNPERWVGLKIRLSWLLVPDVPLTEWVGGDWSRFGLADRIPIVLCVAAMMMVSLAAGALLLHAFGAARRTTQLEYYLFAQAVGLSLLSTFTLAVGLAGGLRYGLVSLVAAGGVLLVSCWRYRALLPLVTSEDPDLPEQTSSPWFLRRESGLGLAAPFAAVIVFGALLPPWHFDAREYHAQVPKEWYQQGKASFLSHNVYGNMPLAAELPAVIGMQAMRGAEPWWWGTLVGKTLIAAYAVLTALSIYALGRRFFTAAAGVAGAILFLSTPWVAFVSMAGLIEGASAYYTTLTFFALLLWQRTSKVGSDGDLVLAGLMAGAAMACKYPAVLFVVLPAAAFVIVTFVVRRYFSSRAVAFFLLGLVLGGGLWLAKNAVLTGNPTYPLLYELFGGTSWTDAKHDQWSHAHRAPQYGLTLPALQNTATVLLISSERTSPLLVPFGLLGLWAARKQWLVLATALLLLFVVATWWTLTHRLERFLIPHLPLLAIVAGLGVTYVRHQFWNVTVAAILIFSLVCNLTYISSRSVAGDNRFWVALEDLRQIRPEEPYDPHIHPAHVYLNRHVRPGYTALLCGEAQVFNLRMPVLYNTCFNDCVFENLFRGRSRQERIDELKQRRISHVMVYWRELDRYRSPGNYGYSDYVTRRVVNDELVDRQQILRPIPLGLDPDNCQLLEVVGWQDWE
jgi:hypothetical protein